MSVWWDRKKTGEVTTQWNMLRTVIPLVVVLVAVSLVTRLWNSEPAPLGTQSYLRDAQVYVDVPSERELPRITEEGTSDENWIQVGGSKRDFPSHSAMRVVVAKFADHRGKTFGEPQLEVEGQRITINIPMQVSSEPITAVYQPSVFSRELQIDALEPGDYTFFLHSREVGTLNVAGKAGARITEQAETLAPEIVSWKINRGPYQVSLRLDGEVELAWSGKVFGFTLPESSQPGFLELLEEVESLCRDDDPEADAQQLGLSYARGTQLYRPRAKSKRLARLADKLASLFPEKPGYGPDKLWVRGVVERSSGGGWIVTFADQSVPFHTEIADKVEGQDVVLFGEFTPAGVGFYDVNDVVQIRN